jgi:hypothetical protein
MNENRAIHLAEIPVGGESGLMWNLLHMEREDICEALLKDPAPAYDDRRASLEAQLRNVNDALDRLMSRC